MLRTVSVGRLAVLADGRPDIFPVNYTIDGRTLAFRTGEATKLGKASKGAEVALEADGVDPDSGPPGAWWPKAPRPLSWWTQLSGATKASPE